jgi:hypothetical protein
VSGRIAVAIETGRKRIFATAIDWPGWSRWGKTEQAALEALVAAARRYASVAREAGQVFPTTVGAGDLEIVEWIAGDGGTDFGVPGRVTEHDRRAVSTAQADRLRRLVRAAWTIFDRVAERAPAELRKGPRGGGRDRDQIVDHVLGADHGYSGAMGLRAPAATRDDPGSIEVQRAAMLDLLAQPSDGTPLNGRKWPPRYAAARIAWHALDHAWEIEDRSDPA